MFYSLNIHLLSACFGTRHIVLEKTFWSTCALWPAWPAKHISFSYFLEKTGQGVEEL